MNVEMTPVHRTAAAVVALFFGATPVSARAHLTWGPTVVVEVVLNAELRVFVKASANQNVHTEAEVIGHAHRAGLPVPEVIAVGTHGGLPGTGWMITRAATGTSLEHIGLQASTTVRTLTEIADVYARLHSITLPGFGPLADDGRSGVLTSWSQWQRNELEDSLGTLERAGSVPASFPDRVRRVSEAFAVTLDQGPGALLHADLGDGETFVDPDSGAVTAIVDWGGALVGDPLYDLARFVSGGPADDPRPALAFPVLHGRYLEQTGMDVDRARRLLQFYRLHICVGEAAWGDDHGWTPSLIAWAERLLPTLDL